jgi:hypothetical protein
MGLQRPAQVLIEISRIEDTIGGQISVEGAPATDFFGWLELIDRLERAASAATPTSAEDPNQIAPGPASKGPG